MIEIRACANMELPICSFYICKIIKPRLHIRSTLAAFIHKIYFNWEVCLGYICHDRRTIFLFVCFVALRPKYDFLSTIFSTIFLHCRRL